MSQYFDDDHRHAVTALAGRHIARTEWPTWVLIAVIYGLWLGILGLLHIRAITRGIATPLLVVSGAWYMSLQHELLHGHPTSSAHLNKVLGYAPIAVWIPYTLYRDSHLLHHRNENLTVPGVDPESNYVHVHTWQSMPAVCRALWYARKTFCGRLILGPPMDVGVMCIQMIKRWKRGDWTYFRMWCTHGALLAVMLLWIKYWAGLEPWYYLVAVGWPANSLSMVRSLYEHRAAPAANTRTTINETRMPMRLLFLNNNYHLVHHDLPWLAWYLLPAAYQLRKSEYLEKSGGFFIRGGYAELLRRYAFRLTDCPVHPFSNLACEPPLPSSPPTGHETVQAKQEDPSIRDAARESMIRCGFHSACKRQTAGHHTHAEPNRCNQKVTRLNIRRSNPMSISGD
jgi:fatty acid desaturase